MLTLNNITKDYKTGDEVVHALRGVSLHFRPHEFVAILGPSGCGKTTLLNIIGGLDHYTDGDLVIGGVSTKQYKDKNWDSYRNHRVGFVFQSYNLIPHQTVLSNVELALTLSGVSRAERRVRALAALENVGLGGLGKKKPNQMSGGQMQRVAIARALVNDPDIILADEPTGALDTKTSVQIMDILRSISDRKLIVMVTHNPELAEEYATRIIRVVDGLVVEDSNPYDGVTEEMTEAIVTDLPAEDADAVVTKAEAEPVDAVSADTEAPAAPVKKKKKKKEKTSMSLWTAFSLSLNNLMTKKARTFLTSFAGSIGIIGIALILALSNGIKIFIDRVQEDALSSYPIQLEESTMDLNSMLSSFAGNSSSEPVKDGYIQSNNQLAGMTNAILSGYKENDLTAFKQHLESDAGATIRENATVQYHYGITPHIYTNQYADRNGNYCGINPSTVYSSLMGAMGMDQSTVSMNLWSELLDDRDLLESQYNVIAGRWPSAKNEVILVVDKNHRISDMNLYALGIENPNDVYNFFGASAKPGSTEPKNYSFEDIRNIKYRLILPTDYYVKQGDTWTDIRDTSGALNAVIDNRAMDIQVVGIVAPNPDATGTSISGAIGYTSALTEYVISETKKQDIVKEQLADLTVDVLTGQKFYEADTDEDIVKMQKLVNLLALDPSALGDLEIDNFGFTATDDVLAVLYAQTYEQIVFNRLLGPKTMALMMQYPMNPADETATMTAANNILSAVKTTLTDALLTRMLRANPQYAAMEGSFDKNTFVEYLEGNIMASTEMPAMAKYYTMLQMLATLKVYEGTEYDEAIIAERKWAETASNADKAQKYRDYANGLALLTSTDDDGNVVYTLNESNASTCASLWDSFRRVGCSNATLKENKRLLGIADMASPTAIYLYPHSFDAKNAIDAEIKAYNKAHPNKELNYTDMIGIMMSSVETILNVITYVLVGFVAISLVVSSIMIGIITYISVLERIKEIGILRAVGASKANVSQVFLAETAIVGFIAGLIGILTTLVLCIPTNIIIRALSGFENISAQLPFWGAVTLILISMGLTLIAGLFPAMIAAKKEPVDALRTE